VLLGACPSLAAHSLMAAITSSLVTIFRSVKRLPHPGCPADFHKKLVERRHPRLRGALGSKTHCCLVLLINFKDLRGTILRAGFPDDGDYARSRRLPDSFCLYTICDPNGGPPMIAWVLAFLGFPPPPWGFPGSLNRLRSCCRLRTVRRCRSRREPQAHIKRKANRSQ
jgi:hypothetical protein